MAVDTLDAAHRAHAVQNCVHARFFWYKRQMSSDKRISTSLVQTSIKGVGNIHVQDACQHPLSWHLLCSFKGYWPLSSQLLSKVPYHDHSAETLPTGHLDGLSFRLCERCKEHSTQQGCSIPHRRHGSVEPHGQPLPCMGGLVQRSSAQSPAQDCCSSGTWVSQSYVPLHSADIGLSSEESPTAAVPWGCLAMFLAVFRHLKTWLTWCLGGT